MDVVNKVRLRIGGVRYTVATQESAEYVLELARAIDKDIKTFLDKSATISLNDALVLCLLDYADERRKSERSADHIRDQLTGYLGDASKARMESDELRGEVSRLRRELALLKKGKT